MSNSIAKLMDATSKAFRLGPLELRGPARHKEHCRARHIFAFIARSVYLEKFVFIGFSLNRDHATAMHSYRLVRDNPARFEPELSAIISAVGGTNPMLTPAHEIHFLRLRVKDLEAKLATRPV